MGTATRLCVSKLWVQTLSGLRSNYVYINHMNPMIEGVDLVYPREVKNIHLPDKEGALPTDGSGKIKIRGQYLGKNNEKAAVIFRGRSVQNDCNWTRAFSEVECNLREQGQGQRERLEMWVGIQSHRNDDQEIRLKYAPPTITGVEAASRLPTRGGGLIVDTGKHFGSKNAELFIGDFVCE